MLLQETTTLRSIAAGLIGLAFTVLAGCGGDGPIQPEPGVLQLDAEGWAERGATLKLSARLGGAAAAGVSFRAEPGSAVRWDAPDLARLLVAGPVTFYATRSNAEGSLAVTVAPPPHIVFESTDGAGRDIWRMALDGAELVRLTDDPAEDSAPSTADGAVHFLSFRVAPAAVFSVPAAGGAATRVTTAAGVFQAPAISPDGQRLAFLRPVGGVTKLFVSDRSGANAQRVTTSGGGVIEVAPAWAPDGQRLAFVSTAAGNADVYVVPAAGGTPQPVGTTAAPEGEPVWSPDGNRVAFVRGSGGQVDLFAVTLATGAEARLTTAPGVASRPAWLPDGRIVFSRNEGAARVLHWLDPARPDAVQRVEHGIAIAGRPAAIR
jgi:hypothetical protein